MSYALVPLIRTKSLGRNGTTRRVFGYDSSPHNFVVLDSGDKTQQESGVALAWFDSLPANAKVEKIADGNSELLAIPSAAKLSAKLKNRPFDRSPFNDQIASLLLTKGLRPRLNGDLNIWLGPGGRGKNKFYFRKLIGRHNSQIFIDTFDRANSALNGSTLSNGGGATWIVTADNVATLNIVSNQCVLTHTGSGTDYEGARAVVDTECDSDDISTELSWVQSAVSNSGTDVFLNAAVASDFSSGYGFRIKNVVSDYLREIFAISTETILDSDTTNSSTATGKIERQGSDVEGFIGGVSVLGPATDTNEPSGAGFRYCGFYTSIEFFGGSGTNTNTLNNFDGRDILAGWGALLSIKRNRLIQ